MKLLIALGVFAVAILLLDKFHKKLPPPFPQIHAAWMKFSHTLGAIMSWLILSILWIIAFGPYAIAFKFTQKKPKEMNSYWIDADPNQDLRHQF